MYSRAFHMSYHEVQYLFRLPCYGLSWPQATCSTLGEKEKSDSLNIKMGAPLHYLLRRGGSAPVLGPSRLFVSFGCILTCELPGTRGVKYSGELVHTGREPPGIAPPSSLALLSVRMADYLVVLLLLLLVLVLQIITTATITS